MSNNLFGQQIFTYLYDFWTNNLYGQKIFKIFTYLYKTMKIFTNLYNSIPLRQPGGLKSILMFIQLFATVGHATKDLAISMIEDDMIFSASDSSRDTSPLISHSYMDPIIRLVFGTAPEPDQSAKEFGEAQLYARRLTEWVRG